ncbi:MAG: hypothetical protein LBP56_09385 [Odoribacteraceae bacterium]|jgi:hypothetical protein|nr:hypothetical protein [Odoribacteraceae bacterium]
MKNRKNIILLAFLATAFVACDLSDPGEPAAVPPGFDLSDDSPAGVRIEKALEDHGVLYRYKFTDVDYSYNWTSSITSMEYVPATDQQSIINVIDYIEQEIFSIFPEGFVKTYMPPTVLLVDSLKMLYTYDDPRPDPPVNVTYHYSIVGNVTASSMVIANVNKNFNNPPSETLKEDLISLFVERLLANKNLPWPDAFVAVSDELFRATGLAASYHPYWNGDFVNIKSWGLVVPDFTDWWGRGILKIGRLGDMGFSVFVWGAYEIETYDLAKATAGQDFGDYVAFILTKTAAEKQAFYDIVAARPLTQNVPGGNPDPRTPQGGPPAVEVMKRKVQLVKDYFKENFNIELKDPS